MTPALSPAEPWFEDVAATSNIDFVHVSGHKERFWLPESVTGGVCLFDYDADGSLDVYLIQGGSVDPSVASTRRNRLYRNRGGWRFEDVTAEAGVGDTGYGIGCACGDYDADGDIDLYVTNVGRDVLYRNNGDGSLSDVTTSSGLANRSFGTSAAFVDHDRDGLLDLMVVNYVNWSPQLEMDCFVEGGRQEYCKPTSYDAPARDILYRNLGGGTFEDVTARVGLDAAFGNGLGITHGDYDGDGLVDLYVANDGTTNQLWINSRNGRFSDKALLAGCALNARGAAEAGMGVASVDIDDDGDLDLFLSHLREETNTFYLNQGGLFEDVTASMGLAAASLPFTGFGLGFADFDHDGRLDLYVANGRVIAHERRDNADDPYAEPNQLFRLRESGRFEEVLPRGGTAELLVATSRGTAMGDLDNDGDIDIVVNNRDARPYLLRNRVGSKGNWIQFRILNRKGHDAVGAVVRVNAGARHWYRRADRAYGYCASNDQRIHVGLGKATRVDSVIVRWPAGGEATFGPFSAGRSYEISEKSTP